MSERKPVRRALLSVYDKTGLAELAAGLHDAGVEIVHPLTVETWGVHRFLFRAPDGTVVNVVEHHD